MLIALYAHARFSGDESLLSSHVGFDLLLIRSCTHALPQYNTTKRWANYLVRQVLTPSNQCVLNAPRRLRMFI